MAGEVTPVSFHAWTLQAIGALSSPELRLAGAITTQDTEGNRWLRIAHDPENAAAPYAVRVLPTGRSASFRSFAELADALWRLPHAWFVRARMDVPPVAPPRVAAAMGPLLAGWMRMGCVGRRELAATLHALYQGRFEALAEDLYAQMLRRLYKCNVWVEVPAAAGAAAADVIERRPFECRDTWAGAVRASGRTAYGLLDAFELPFVRAAVGALLGDHIALVAALLHARWDHRDPLRVVLTEVEGEPAIVFAPDPRSCGPPDLGYTDWRE